MNRDGGRGDAERISFLLRVGDLNDKGQSKKAKQNLITTNFTH